MKTLLAAVILAHSWYPHECCSDQDCRPVPCADLTEHPQLPHLLMHGAHHIHKNEVRVSPDGQCHVCESITSAKMYCAWQPLGMS